MSTNLCRALIHIDGKDVRCVRKNGHTGSHDSGWLKPDATGDQYRYQWSQKLATPKSSIMTRIFGHA